MHMHYYVSCEYVAAHYGLLSNFEWGCEVADVANICGMDAIDAQTQYIYAVER